MSNVDLGFLEDCEHWQVDSRLFPSKLGGKPAWLSLDDLPSSEDLECEACKSPMIFLCQIYAPFEEDPENFHRTIFIFICRNGECCIPNNASNIKIFRSSLGRENKFYSSEPPIEQEDNTFSLSKWVKLCELCGCLSTKNCGKCKTVYYCTRAHQVLDWKERHKKLCGKEETHCKYLSNSLFSEKQIEMEAEEIENCAVDEQEEMEKFKRMEEQQCTGTLSGVTETELESHAKVDTDEEFSKFKDRVNQYPDQIIRYDRGGEPLWIAKEPVPIEIPNCEYCGSTRQFELQIMPQTLSLIKENDLDWGVLLIYTCVRSCTDGRSYKKEYVFKQDVSSNDL